LSLAPDISLAAVKQELAAVADYATAANLQLCSESLDEKNLKFYVRFENEQRDVFHAEFDCGDYPLYPPTIEFVSENSLDRGLKTLYPQGFHTTPCICMRYSRKAYAERGGPHGDWRLLDWRLPTGSGIAIDSLVLMVSDLHSKIRRSVGRMA
jgi:hypothetical protein